MEVQKPANRSFLTLTSAFFKRGFDFIFAAIGLILLSPVFLLIAILIKRDSPGPVFYQGKRMGKNQKLFMIQKFRTMTLEAWRSPGPPITTKDDPRITKIGRYLRDTKLNELPQLWNVLVGEMSFVGPRPELLRYTSQYDDIEKYILKVRFINCCPENVNTIPKAAFYDR